MLFVLGWGGDKMSTGCIGDAFDVKACGKSMSIFDVLRRTIMTLQED